MKHLLLFFSITVPMLFASCQKSKEGESGGDLIRDTPQTEVPGFLNGQWLNGNFAMSQWWGYDGRYIGNPYQSSRAFTFTADGQAEFFQVIKTHNGSCTTEALTYFKGTVAFDVPAGKFVFYPRQGTFRGFYSCTPGSNFSRAAARNELNPIALYYEEQVDDNGQKWMVTSFSANAPDSEKSYFKLTNW